MENELIQIFAVSALLAAALLQVILAIAGYRSRAERRQREQDLRGLQKALMAANGENTALGKRLGMLERHMANLPAPPPEARMQGAPIGQAYEVAVNLVRRGTSVEELISTCGLTHGEADLIMRLYGPPATGSAAASPKGRTSLSHSAAAAYEASY